MMKPWGFVFLAYGIVWIALALYFFMLKRRIHGAQKELDTMKNNR